MAAVIQVPSGVPQLVYQISWEKLPDDYRLPDEPVDNTDHSLLAAALRESLELAGLLDTPERLVASNVGICTTVSGRTVVKAPDWFYVSHVLPLDPPRARRSYTPHLEGEVPTLVIEFLSETDGGEYSYRPFFPYGKLWYYERILQVPYYVIFEPEAGTLEVRRLEKGSYQLQQADEQGRYCIAPLNLFVGIWQGTKADRTGRWLRWWDTDGKLLLWGAERLEQERQRAEEERQRAEEERQRAEQEHQRAERLAAYLRAQGFDPEKI
jgi:Uma2 family endonuclease